MMHTIISQETIIKPSSPTPSHLNTYNLSVVDQLANRSYVPFILFYPNNSSDCSLTSKDKASVLKKSLSQCLTQYYPFAGRMTAPWTPYVECNDAGVVFIEAQVESHINTYLYSREQNEAFYSLFANNLICYSSPSNTSLVAVQLNHFSCGGIGLAVSMSHVIGDAATLATFLTHWATLTRYGLTDLKPVYLHSTLTSSIHPKRPTRDIDYTNLVTKKFVFPNSKLSDLKEQVVFEAGGSINNPTRVEVLTSLLYKTLVAVATKNNGLFKPSYMFMMFNVRDKFIQKLPQATIGNFVSIMLLETRHASETSLSVVVDEIKKYKLELEGIQSVEHLAENISTMGAKLRSGDLDNLANGLCWCTSMCGFAFNEVDFGWGNSKGATYAIRSSNKNGFALMDAPDGDGIEAWVVMEKEDMEVFENDKEMLLFCQIN